MPLLDQNGNPILPQGGDESAPGGGGIAPDETPVEDRKPLEPRPTPERLWELEQKELTYKTFCVALGMRMAPETPKRAMEVGRVMRMTVMNSKQRIKELEKLLTRGGLSSFEVSPDGEVFVPPAAEDASFGGSPSDIQPV